MGVPDQIYTLECLLGLGSSKSISSGGTVSQNVNEALQCGVVVFLIQGIHLTCQRVTLWCH